MSSPQFDPVALEHAVRDRGNELDLLPFGVIVVDRNGTIIEYNAYESDLSKLPKERVVGRNFFHDVAPCTAIKEFEGRFDAFLTSSDTSIAPFEYVFKFARGHQRVSVVFVRLSFDSERATICIARRPAE